MATKSLDKQMGEFMSPATDEAPTMGAMDAVSYTHLTLPTKA